MKRHLLSIMLVALLGASHGQCQLLTGFGSLQINPFNTINDFLQVPSPWTGAVTTNSLIISGVSNSSGGIYDVLPNAVSITGDTAYLALSGSLQPPNPNVNIFQLTLYDSSYNSLTYTSNWSLFNNTLSTDFIPLTASSGAFNGTVSSWELDVGGNPGDTLSFTFNSLQSTAIPSLGSIPEPSTYALVAIGLGLLLLRQKRRKTVLA